MFLHFYSFLRKFQQLLYEVNIFYYLHKVPLHEKTFWALFEPSQRLGVYWIQTLFYPSETLYGSLWKLHETISVILHIISEHSCNPTYPREIRERLDKPAEEAGGNCPWTKSLRTVHSKCVCKITQCLHRHKQSSVHHYSSQGTQRINSNYVW